MFNSTKLDLDVGAHHLHHFLNPKHHFMPCEGGAVRMSYRRGCFLLHVSHCQYLPYQGTIKGGQFRV